MCDNWASYGGNVGEDTEGKGETLIHDSALIVHTTNVYDATVWCRVPESTLQTEIIAPRTQNVVCDKATVKSTAAYRSFSFVSYLWTIPLRRTRRNSLCAKVPASFISFSFVL